MGITEQKINGLIGSLSRCNCPDDIAFMIGLLKDEREQLHNGFTVWAEAYQRSPIPEVKERVQFYTGLLKQIDNAIQSKCNERAATHATS